MISEIGLVKSTSIVTNDYGVPLLEVTAQVGGEEIISAEFFPMPGEDSRPLPGDWVFLVRRPGAGRYVAIGMIDDVLLTTSAGEKRIYSRLADGTIVAELKLFNGDVRAELQVYDDGGSSVAKLEFRQTGQVTLTNDGSGFFQMFANGDVEINGTVFAEGGDIEAPGTIDADGEITGNGIELSTHVHGGVETGGGSTNPPTP